jgi:putative tryptophan/tyrosine transport system substrate-binding protein
MRRRDFIALAAGTAAAWPLTARAQQGAMPIVGYLGSRSRDSDAPLVNAFRLGLKDTGHVEGQNVLIEFRWSDGRYDRLPELAADLVRRRVSAIMAAGNPAALPAKAATATIPIVFSGSLDPVRAGLVASLNRPGGNVTGVYNLGSVLSAKSLELLREIAPAATRIALLVNPANPNAETILKDAQDAGRTLGMQFHTVNASTDAEIDAAFATLTELRAGALVTVTDALFTDRREKIVALALRHRIPSIYAQREFAVAGGLMSYGASLTDAYQLAGGFVGRILKGAQPGELPIMQSSKFELVINLKTAKALGLDVPQSFYWRADEVIE